jgi:hypothetical protein
MQALQVLRSQRSLHPLHSLRRCCKTSYGSGAGWEPAIGAGGRRFVRADGVAVTGERLIARSGPCSVLQILCYYR